MLPHEDRVAWWHAYLFATSEGVGVQSISTSAHVGQTREHEYILHSLSLSLSVNALEKIFDHEDNKQLA